MSDKKVIQLSDHPLFPNRRDHIVEDFLSRIFFDLTERLEELLEARSLEESDQGIDSNRFTNP